jgi:hypothetical protein
MLNLGEARMKRKALFRPGIMAFLVVSIAGPVLCQNGAKASATDESKLVYADFQDQQYGRPVSKHGGMVRLNPYSQNSANPPQFRGLSNANPPAPAFARVTADDIAAAFDYEMRIPNEWEGVNMEVFGEPEKDGKLVPDDVSGYKFITFRTFAKGAQYLKLELITRGLGASLESGYPSATIRLSPGFNTYKLKLDSFSQPEWATHLDLKLDVLKKLTSVTIGVHCDKCTLEKGTVVVDNIAFEN